MGMLSPVGPLAIAAKSGAKRAWLWSIGSGLATALAFTLITVGSAGGAIESFGLFVLLANLVVSTTYTMVTAGDLSWGPKRLHAPLQPVPLQPPPPPPPPSITDRNQAAIASARAIQQKRNEALKIVSRDPHLARELRIGRPDLPRQYDDGGLVDINGVPPEVYIRVLGLSPEQSAQIVETREYLGRFEHLDDLANLAGLDMYTYDKIKHRLIAL
jgi:DNA uptake protein ComE-like DNA-binding protein